MLLSNRVEEKQRLIQDSTERLLKEAKEKYSNKENSWGVEPYTTFFGLLKRSRYYKFIGFEFEIPTNVNPIRSIKVAKEIGRAVVNNLIKAMEEDRHFKGLECYMSFEVYDEKMFFFDLKISTTKRSDTRIRDLPS
jgi:hypothetical protein